jgi:hypothetical protein
MRRQCLAVDNEHCLYAGAGLAVDADRLNETLEECARAARKKIDRDDADFPDLPRASAYARGLEDAYLDIRDRVFKTKDYGTARRVAGHD